MIRAGIRRVLNLAVRRRDRWERDVEEEIKLHIALRAEQLVEQGATPDQAYREAVRKFGSLVESRARLIDAARHREARMQRTEYLSDLRQDIGFALRSLGRERTWTAVALLTFALGIGATTAVFSVVSTLLLHAVPYPNANRVVFVYQQPSNGNNTGIQVTISPAASAIRGWKEHARSFESLEPGRIGPVTLKTVSGDPSSIMSAAVSPSFPKFAGLAPLTGRMFSQNDIDVGRHVVVLAEGFWRERLGADPRVLGQMLTLNDSSYMIVGVAPAALRFGSSGSSRIDVWIPFDLRDKNAGGSVIGRLRPGVTIPGAQRELDSIFARTAGFTNGRIPFRTVIATPAQRVRFRDSLFLLTGAVGLLLLVACVNVAHLLLARAAMRQRELAIRAALGAGRGRLFRQLLTESFLLTAGGAALGLVVGWLGVHALIALRPGSHDELRVAHLDATTLAVAIAVAVTSGIVFGLVGAVQTARQSTSDSLKAGSVGLSGAGGQRRLRSALVVSEMALSAMLIVGAGLVIRSLMNLQQTDLGFDVHGLYALYPTFARERGGNEQQAAAMSAFAERVAAMPGVRSTSVADIGPGSRSFSIGRFEIDGETAPPSSSSSFVDVNHVQPSYFSTLGIRLVEGATFTDTSDASHAVIVNEGFARKHWPPGAAVGRRIRVAQTGNEPWLTIVGVAHDASTSGPMSESSAPLLYLPPSGSVSRAVIVRTTGAANVLAPVRSIARELGISDVPIDGAEDFVERSISEPRFVTLIMTIFGSVSLLLASIGLYGVMAYSVAQETREIGIRVALGASRAHILRRVMARGIGLAVSGAAGGVIAATWGSKLIEAQLYGVKRLDATSFALAVLVLIAAALVACVVPMRRALAVDPMTAIRAD